MDKSKIKRMAEGGRGAYHLRKKKPPVPNIPGDEWGKAGGKPVRRTQK